VDDDLVATGRYARLDIDPIDGDRHRMITVGFVPGEDGSIVVAATAPDARWAGALATAAKVRVTIAERSFDATPEELAERDPGRGLAVRDLILRYGTPSEGLGRGPVFRLRPIAPG
jgi:hypothetical protein